MGKRRFRILDTNVLIHYWHRWRLWEQKETEVANWAPRLIEVSNTNLIASPVRIEFLCGAENSARLKLSLACLDPFEVVDGGKIPRQDWEEAERSAKRFGRHRRRRKLGDCLLRAISDRLNCDVVTADSDFERRLRP